jgi:hypothetical protein
MEWIDAIMECRFINAEFVIIETLDELNHIKDALKHFLVKDSLFNSSYYIGAEDQLRSNFYLKNNIL